MKCKTPLSDLYQWYISGNMSKKDFEGRIFQYLLDNFEQYRIFDKDKNLWDDFLSWLYPRIARAIDLYRDLGSSFDAYISGLVYKAFREWRRTEAEHRTTEYICWQARAEDMRVGESEGEYCEEARDVSIPEGIKPRQILLLLLKSYYFVTDEFAQRVTHTIGAETEEVMNMLEELRKQRTEREDEILELRDRLYCQFYRCLAYQKQMETAQPGTCYYEKMKDRYERAKQRFLAMKKRLGKIRLDASNRMIADVTGIPKGTVDSGLFALRNLLASNTDSAV